MCAHAVITCYFNKTVWLFRTTNYDTSDETVKECLSHQYVMKLHRHASHEMMKLEQINGHNLFKMMWNMITYM